MLLQAGWNPDGLIRFLETLLELRDDEPSKLDSPFLTHPMIEDRIDSTRRIIERLPPRDTAALQNSSPAYDSLMAELERLPPPKRSEFR